MADERTELGMEIEAGLREAIAHRQGKIALATRIIDPMPAAMVKEIRKRHANSTKEFERRFGVPARTLEGWEQGRKIDVATRVLLITIDQEPEAVERAVHRRDAVRKPATA